jgi:thymidylate synthase (FAD)
MITVLDKGYVRLVDHMGDDLSIVNAARASFMKESTSMTPKDEGLLNYLIREVETEPFRHPQLTFEVYAPLMVARQWWKYVVGSAHLAEDEGHAWSESSRRYVTENPEYYIPWSTEWRSAPDNKKQGSGAPIPHETGVDFTQALVETCKLGTSNYETLIEMGVAPEQARLFLPAYAMYVRWRWTASLQTVCWFLAQRMAHKAQYEIHQYAVAVAKLTGEVFPRGVRLAAHLVPAVWRDDDPDRVSGAAITP